MLHLAVVCYFLYIFQLCECAVIYLFILLLLMLKLFPMNGIWGHSCRVGVCLALEDTNKAGFTLPWPLTPSMSLSFFLLQASWKSSTLPESTSWLPIYSSVHYSLTFTIKLHLFSPRVTSYMLITKFDVHLHLIYPLIYILITVHSLKLFKHISPFN